MVGHPSQRNDLKHGTLNPSDHGWNRFVHSVANTFLVHDWVSAPNGHNYSKKLVNRFQNQLQCLRSAEFSNLLLHHQGFAVQLPMNLEFQGAFAFPHFS